MYELTIKIIQSDDLSQIGSQPFDVLILHQLPDIYGMGGNVVSRLLEQGKPTLYLEIKQISQDLMECSKHFLLLPKLARPIK